MQTLSGDGTAVQRSPPNDPRTLGPRIRRRSRTSARRPVVGLRRLRRHHPGRPGSRDMVAGVTCAKQCKRGGFGPRTKSGHCRCEACKAFNLERERAKSADRLANKAKWRAANPGKSLEYSKRWAASHPEKRKAAVEAWRAKNPAKVAEINKRAGRKWSAENKGKRLASVRARQIAKMQRTPKWAEVEAISAIYAACAEMTRVTGIPHEVDHIIPLQGRSASGLHVATNLQIMPRGENRAKRNKWSETWERG